jgi:hypothetical protein
VDVFLLWHIRHADSSQHRDADSELVWDEEDGDDLKKLGVYSSEQRASERIEQAGSLPGFIGEPDCFMINRHLVDRDEWTEGFVVVPHNEA